MTYRADIDGLRAIAVLAVVLFHVNESWLSAGFIGVDIFFTISGFLITGILLRSHAQGSTSLSTFYRNRIRRIVPVLTVVILCTLAFGQWVLLPKDLIQLANSALASQIFAANVFFTYFQDTAYFAPDSRLQPLLHLWSLGTEEQFYLLWPILLLAGTRHLRPTTLLTLIGLVTAASFLFGQFYYAVDPLFSYYMLPGRAGQLLAGALCYFALARNSQPAVSTATISVLSGLILIGLSLFLLSPNKTYPGFNAIPVTVGSALILYGGGTVNPVSRVLSSPPLVYIGLLSYSIYLWHWPVLAYARYLYSAPGFAAQLALMALIFVLSWLSYTFVETPLRRSDRSLKGMLLAWILLPTVVVASAAAFIDTSKGYGLYRNDKTYRMELRQARQQGKKAPRSSFVCQPRAVTEDLFESADCLIGNPKQADILLWGDSNAAHYVGVFKELSAAYGLNFRNIALGACPPITTEPGRYAPAKVRERCTEFINLMRDRATLYRLHIISGNWAWYLQHFGIDFESALEDTVTGLRQDGVEVVLLGRIPTLPRFDRLCQAKSLKVPLLNCPARLSVSAEEADRVNQIIQNLANRTGAEYLDFNDLLCDEQGVCSGELNDTVLYFDKHHLSIDGAATLGAEVLDSQYHSQLFKELAR